MNNPKIPQFNSNTFDPYRFARNFDTNVKGEANLYINIWNEAIHKVGIEVYYIERVPGEPESIFGEYLTSKLTTATRMFLQADNLTNNGGWQTPDMFTKFGLNVSDEETFTCPKITFSQAKINPSYVENSDENQFLPFYPKQGDLIYIVNAKKLMEIQHIEDEVSLGYIFGNRNAYQIKCKTYVYDHTEISNDNSIPKEIKALDTIQNIHGEIYNVEQKEKQNFNDNISSQAEHVIDNSEVDSLFK